jgi:hypothetical protein
VQRAGSEHRPGAAPHELAPLVFDVRADQRLEPVGILRRRREPLQHEPDARLAHPEAPLVVLVGPVGLVRLLEVRNVVAAQLGKTAPLQRVERLHDTRTAEIDRAETARVVLGAFTVDRMRRPAVGERVLRVVDNRADRSPHTAHVPRLVD